MKLSVKNSIYQAIIDGKWLDISYVNKKKESTNFFICINDINVDKGTITCDIFNPYKSNTVIEAEEKNIFIYIDSIVSASILEQTYYDVPKELIKKVTTDKKISEYLDIIKFDNNILSYLSDCYRFDNDPFLKEIIMIDGIDTHTLLTSNKYKLDDAQFDCCSKKCLKNQNTKLKKSIDIKH